MAITGAYYVGHFVSKMGGTLAAHLGELQVALWSIIPLFLMAELLRRYLDWKWPYLIGSIMIGSYTIFLGVISVGYMGIYLGTPPHLTVVWCLITGAALSLLALITHQLGPKVVKIDLSHKEPFSTLKKRVTIVHLSDIHLSTHTRLSWVKELVEKVNALEPDYIVFTGDLIDINPDKIPEHVAALAGLKAKEGKLAVSGNHDFMTGIHLFYGLCEALGFTYMDGKQIKSQGLTFIGVPDEISGKSTHPKLNGDEKDSLVIFLKHRPTGFKKSVEAGVHLQLSGHSHKGQIFPLGFLVKLRYQKYAHGLHRYKKGHIFTTTGTGVWGPPMRLFSPSEIVHITL